MSEIAEMLRGKVAVILQRFEKLIADAKFKILTTL